VDEAVVEGAGVVDGADEVVVAAERGIEVGLACVQRGDGGGC
jgi:hypothetical protein|tara:strand:- start:623 stop:748 length:126 start_codon:yes stop_codon:yes gene_type:complete